MATLSWLVRSYRLTNRSTIAVALSFSMAQAPIPQVHTFGSQLGNRAFGCHPGPFRPTGAGRLANCNQYTVQQVLGLDLAVGWLN